LVIFSFTPKRLDRHLVTANGYDKKMSSVVASPSMQESFCRFVEFFRAKIARASSDKTSNASICVGSLDIIAVYALKIVFVAGQKSTNAVLLA
jgi:hypothetical protein